MPDDALAHAVVCEPLGARRRPRRTTLDVLHGSDELGGALGLQPGLHVGGCPIEAQRLVSRAAVAAESFSFFSGYYAWPVSRLRLEVASGQWGVAKASSSLVLGALRQKGRMGAAQLEAELSRGLAPSVITW